jgi:hypothetical protein
MALSPEDRTEIAALVDARLKLTRHENDDHLDRALLVAKLKPSATNNDALYTSSGSSVWLSGGSRFKIGAFAVSAGTGIKAYTGVGFQPALVQFHVSYGDDAHMIFGLGGMTADGMQYCQSHTMVAGAFAERNTAAGCVYVITNAGATACLGAFSSMDADGFSINYSVVDTAVRVNYVAYR